MLALALRQSVRQEPLKKAAQLHIPEWDAAGVRKRCRREKGPLFIAAPYETRLDDVATTTSVPRPTISRAWRFAVAHALDAERPACRSLR